MASRSRARAHRRQLAGDDRDDEKDDERDPVVRVGDREGADRRHEEEVEAERRDHGGRDRHGHRRGRRDEEHDEQEVRATVVADPTPSARSAAVAATTAPRASAARLASARGIRVIVAERGRAARPEPAATRAGDRGTQKVVKSP